MMLGLKVNCKTLYQHILAILSTCSLNRIARWTGSPLHRTEHSSQSIGAWAFVFAGIMLLTAPQSSSQKAALQADIRSAQVDALFRSMDTRTTPGCALAVMKDGRILYERGYGTADLEHDIPITPTTIFHVASMSKQFTAAAILLLAQAGKLSLDDSVRKYIPELPDFGREITIQQLIHHTSGLREELGLLDLSGWRYPADLITDQDILTLVSHQKALNFPPGSRFEYSNTNYLLLAQIVKRVCGQSFRDFTTFQIFDPLRMKDSHFQDDHAEVIRNAASAYEPFRDTYRVRNTNNDTVGHTGLLTTVEDLARWDENFYRPQVGTAAMMKLMQQPGPMKDGESMAYTFGLEAGTYHGLVTVEHGGLDGGYRSDMLRFPDQHFTAVCLCNSLAANPGQLTRKIAEIYLVKQMMPVETPSASDSKEVKLTANQLQSKVGSYRNAVDGHVARIFLKGGRLQIAWGTGGESQELKALSENHFFVPSDQSDFTFEPMTAGNLWRLQIKENQGSTHILEGVADFMPSTAELSAYAGMYHSEEIAPLYQIDVEQEKLVLHRLKNEPDLLRPMAHDVFSGSVGNLTFLRNSHGDVNEFLLDRFAIQNLRFEKSEPADFAK